MLRDRMLRAVFVFAVTLLVCCAAPAWADGAADRLFPPGGQRGTTVTVTFPGMAKEERATLVVDGAGITPAGAFLKGVGKVVIAADAEPGVRQLRLVGAKSATQPRPFAVGVLPEVLEREPNDTLESAQRLEPPPLTLNGSIPKAGDVDNYRIALKKGDFLVVASESRRLAGPVYLALYVRDGRGHSVPVDLDNRQLDPRFTCSIPADGDYYLQLCDVTTNLGNIDESCQYRLHITTGPWLDYVTPASAGRGETVRLTLHGWNLGGKPGPGTAMLDQSVPLSAGPSLAISGAAAPNRLNLLISDAPETGETEPNDTPAQAQPLTLPARVHGAFGRRGDVDCFRFTARAGELLRFDVDAREAGSLADPVLTLIDRAGKELLRVDDGDRTRDPMAFWTAPADGEYVVELRDLAGGSRGGPGSYYRLTIGPARPQVSLVGRVAHLVLKAGGKAEWPLTVYQAHQPQPLTLRMEGLPAGVTAETVPIKPAPNSADQVQARLVITAAAGAMPGFSVVRVVAVGPDGAPVATAAWMLTGDGNQPLGSGATEQGIVLIEAP